jgi:beta-1,4-mannosyltransferase
MLRGKNPGGTGTGGHKRKRHVAIVVLGDIGRSPRMQYHAMSLVELDPAITVSLVGYEGERCVPAVQDHPRIKQLYVDPLVGKGLR